MAATISPALEVLGCTAWRTVLTAVSAVVTISAEYSRLCQNLRGALQSQYITELPLSPVFSTANATFLLGYIETAFMATNVLRDSYVRGTAVCRMPDGTTLSELLPAIRDVYQLAVRIEAVFREDYMHTWLISAYSVSLTSLGVQHQGGVEGELQSSVDRLHEVANALIRATQAVPYDHGEVRSNITRLSSRLMLHPAV